MISWYTHCLWIFKVSGLNCFFPPEFVFVHLPLMFLKSKKKIHGWTKCVHACPSPKVFLRNIGKWGGAFAEVYFIKCPHPLILGENGFSERSDIHHECARREPIVFSVWQDDIILYLDVTMTHDRWTYHSTYKRNTHTQSVLHPWTTGAPQADGIFNNTDRIKIRHYRQIYTDRPDPIVFLTVTVRTSGHGCFSWTRIVKLVFWPQNYLRNPRVKQFRCFRPSRPILRALLESGQGDNKKIESIRINLRDLAWSQVLVRVILYSQMYYSE
jgi:hypothetical protein